jgi:hypothetical protein
MVNIQIFQYLGSLKGVYLNDWNFYLIEMRLDKEEIDNKILRA